MKNTKWLRTASVTCLILAAAAGPVSANTGNAPTPIEDARAILVANNIEQTIDGMFTQLVPVMESGFLGQIGQIDGGAELIRKIESEYPGGQKAFGKRFGELLMVGLRAEYKTIIEQAAEQFVAEIKPADLALIRAFMESSSGQAMTAAQPKMQQKMSAAGQAVGRKAGENAAVQLMSEAGQYLGTGI